MNVDQIIFFSFPNFNYDRNTHMDFYAQDVWTINDRLTINAGFRYGSQRMGYLGSNNTPGGPCDAALGCLREIADVDPNVHAALPLLFGSGRRSSGEDNLISWWNIAPRVGFTYDLTGEGRSVLKGYFGRYYHNMNTGIPAANPGGTQDVTYEFLDQNMNGLFDGVNELGTRLVETTAPDSARSASAPVAGARIDQGIVQPYVDEISVSAEHQIGSDIGVRFSFVHKRQTGAWGNLNIARVGRLTNSKTIACPAACGRARIGLRHRSRLRRHGADGQRPAGRGSPE